MGRHAKLGPSGWKQWGTCPGSIHLIQELSIPNKSSKYAAEGSVAHWVHESCLLNKNNADNYIGEKKEFDGFKFKVTKPMAEAVQTSVDYVRKRIFEAEANDQRVEMVVERWVSLKHLNIEGLDGGTADVILIFYSIWDDEVVEIEVIDYKHGAGVSVDPENNGQAMMYALGATEIDQVKGCHCDNGITITICQPRCFSADGPIRSWNINHTDLILWEEEQLIPRASATLTADAPLVPSVDGCRFCDAAGDCQAMYKLTVDTAMIDFADDDKKPAGLTMEQKLKIIQNKSLINMFFDAVSKRIFNEIISGSKEYADYFKLVRAKTNRKLIDDWEEEISFHLDEEEIYNRKPKALGELEKSLDKVLSKKERIDFMKEITIKPEGGLTMVTLDDKRDSISTDAQNEDWG